jgi:hypothetical protein
MYSQYGASFFLISYSIATNTRVNGSSPATIKTCIKTIQYNIN